MHQRKNAELDHCPVGVLSLIGVIEPFCLSRCTFAAGFGERGFLFGDDRRLWGEFRVQSGVVGPLFRKVVFVENRFDWAFWHAGFAVDAFIRMDVEHRFAFVEALHGAHDDAVGVLTIEAGFGNNVSHVSSFRKLVRTLISR